MAHATLIENEKRALTDATAVASTAEPLRVLHMHSGNLYGGVETLLTALAHCKHACPELQSDFALCFEGRLSEELKAAGVTVYPLGRVRISQPWTVWRARRRLTELLGRRRYDAVICHMPWPMVIFGKTARAQSRKVVFWAHNCHSGEGWLERMARWTVPDVAISSSRFVGASLSNLYPRLQPETVYAPLSLAEAPQAAQSRNAMRRQMGVDRDTVVILQASRFERCKGHLLHLQALSRLRTEKKWACWFAGGPQNPSDQQQYGVVRKCAEELRLSDHVSFLGQRSDIAQLMAAADIFCQPNEGPEAFGIVFVEALWAGLPVVTTALGGALEIIDESCGILTAPGDANNLAAVLDDLIPSPTRRARLGEAGPARARQLCDPATQMRALAGALAKLKKGVTE
jgi:glycosyltransferase involved in cell wall biosynthesis